MTDRTELRDVAAALNQLASRLGVLLAAEREEVADLSHRLRTPMTSLRLEADSLSDPEEREAILGQIDRLEGAIDALITAARTKGAAVGTSRNGSRLSGIPSTACTCVGAPSTVRPPTRRTRKVASVGPDRR